MLCTHHHHHHHRLRVFITEGRMGGAWEPFKLRRSFGNLKALDGKKFLDLRGLSIKIS